MFRFSGIVPLKALFPSSFPRWEPSRLARIPKRYVSFIRTHPRFINMPRDRRKRFVFFKKGYSSFWSIRFTFSTPSTWFTLSIMSCKWVVLLI